MSRAIQKTSFTVSPIPSTPKSSIENNGQRRKFRKSMFTPTPSIPIPSPAEQQQTPRLPSPKVSTSPKQIKPTPLRPKQRNSSASPVAGPCFAGSRFHESPSAHVLPLPPMEWIQKTLNVSTEESKLSTSAPASPSTADKYGSGLRLHPLQLIAACAAS